MLLSACCLSRPQHAGQRSSKASHGAGDGAELDVASRRRLDVLARSLAMYLIRDLIGESFQQIGHWFSRRDHTTVMHACRKIALDLDQDAVTRQAVLDIRRTLTSGAHEGRGTVRDAPRRGKRVRWA